MNEYVISFRLEEPERFQRDNSYNQECSKLLTEALQRVGAEVTGIASLVSVGIKYEGSREDLMKRLGEEKYDLKKLVIDEATEFEIGNPLNWF